MEVTQAEFARMCGVRPPSISEKIKNGTLILNSGKRLDTDNPVNRNYLTAKQNKLQFETQTQNFANITRPASTNSAKPRKTEKIAVSSPATPLNAATAQNSAITTGLSEAMLNMTIQELVVNYGGIAGIERFTKTLQTLTAANEKELRIQERRQELIPKDFVTSRLFGYIDQLMSKLLDYPEGAVDTIIAKILADKNCRSDVVNYLRDGLTRCICDAKQHIANELDGLRGKYDTNRTEIEELKETIEGLRNAD
jgi:hypothetical protein